MGVVNGETFGVVAMGDDFTNQLWERVQDFATGGDLLSFFPNDDGFGDEMGFEEDDEAFVNNKMDVTNRQIAFIIQMRLVEAFGEFIDQLVESCNLPKDIAKIPLVLDEPVYGNEDMPFTDFMAPGIIMTIVHSMSLTYSAMVVVMERNEGLLDRGWVAGVTPGEFALAHFLVSLVFNLLQVTITLIFPFLIFDVTAEGSMVLTFLLFVLQGICGTTIGLIVSALCQTLDEAVDVGWALFFPSLLLSGIIWPVESMPTALRYIAYTLPETFACEAMRGILLRGWGLSYMPVWRGFLMTIAWIVATYAIFKFLVSYLISKD